MLHLKLTQEFQSGAVRNWRLLAPAAESLRLRMFKGASTAAVGAVAGWGGVVMLGAMLMTGARHEARPVAPESAPAVAAISTPAPAQVAAAPAPAPVVAQAKPAPSPAPTKVTQRVDMSPTAAIPDTPKPHKKAHKKKTKDLDNPN